MIQMEDVTVRYSNGTEALKQVNLEVAKGDFVFVVGSSGSGKSTFIKTLLGEVPVFSGNVHVAGRSLNQMKRKQRPYYRRNLGVVFQEFRLLEDRNVFENVALAQRVIGVSRDRMKKNVTIMLDMVGLSKKSKALPKELSGGEQQRVAIARAMVNRPGILLADEPTGNLDPNNSWEIMMLLEEMNRLGTTVIVVTHNNEIVDRMKKRVVVLNQGSLISDQEKGGYTQ
ncbi:MAG: cell division ATP-binding protein FtsE [Clostridiaceae bacterium]|nr:cell division ATP-binding protein FtsE [Clostridiaceae bacterium]